MARGIHFLEDVTLSLIIFKRIKYLAANVDRGLDKIVYMIGSANEPDNSGVSLLHYTQLQSLLFNVCNFNYLIFYY